MYGDREFFVYIRFEKGMYPDPRRDFWGLTHAPENLEQALAREREAFLNNRKSRTVRFYGGAPNGMPPIEISVKDMYSLEFHADGYKIY